MGKYIQMDESRQSRYQVSLEPGVTVTQMSRPGTMPSHLTLSHVLLG